MYGFIRVGAATPNLKVACCEYNSNQILGLIKKAEISNIKILVFPELCITAYTCGDLFLQDVLLNKAKSSLEFILQNTISVDMVIALGLPLNIDNQIFNCAVIINKGKILGVVPKTYIPNYNEFYEKRWFSYADKLQSDTIKLLNQNVPVGTDLIFCLDNTQIKIGVEICEDLWAVIPPSSYLSLNGANIILNLSASNETVSKNEYRLDLISQQSARCMAAYIYSSAGCDESTTDIVFSGHNIIAENGAIIAESEKFSQAEQLIYNDIDTERLNADRKKINTFSDGNINIAKKARTLTFELDTFKIDNLKRFIDPLPFVPKDNQAKTRRCEEIFSIQVVGLAKRIKHTNVKSIVIGISGGLDSTLALLACIKTCDYLKLERKMIIGITMPGFGTSDRTYNNSLNLMKALGVSTKEISIAPACLQHFKDIGHDKEIHDVTYENTQARERTQILMDIANKTNGLVVGTGDLSELALGFATYNGDHMSMYGVNAGIPKTLVRSLVSFISTSDFINNEAKFILDDILSTPVSPELLPPDKNGQIEQKTEDLVGPYELHDFYLYYMVRFGFSPSKILYLAEIAFKDKYSHKEILKWLKLFYKRFFTQQFKRSCLPDAPKVGSICLSPRGDWRMPSDASYSDFISELENPSFN